jgi:hypothetical protein
MSEAMAQGMTDMAAAKNEGLDNGGGAHPGELDTHELPPVVPGGYEASRRRLNLARLEKATWPGFE